MSKVMTIASSCGWWTLSASFSMNVMVYSFVTLILGDRPESWTFCITFRYVFLDLEDCHVEVPPIITLISPSEGRDNSSSFPFNFSSLWSHPKKFLNFPCLMRFFIYYFKSKHSSVSCAWSLWNRQYLFLLRLLGSSFIFFGYFKDGSSLICISTCSSAYIADSELKNLHSYCLDLSSLLSGPSLDEDPAQDGAGDLLPFARLSSSS